MKKFLFSSAILISNLFAVAQCKYKIDFSIATFPPPITNGDTLFGGTPWGNGSRQEIQLPFSFQLFDAMFQSVFYESTGRLVFDTNHFYFVDALSCIGFSDEGWGSLKTKSPIIVDIDSVGGQKRVRIRAQNVRLRNAPSKNVNFEIQLHENNTVHCFVGNHPTINPNTEIDFGPYTGVYHLESISPTIKFKNAQNVIGTTNTQRDTCFKGVVNDYLSFELEDYPANGTKITISPFTSTYTKPVRLESAKVFYQNNILYITSHKNLLGKATITNISTGKESAVTIENGKIEKHLQPNTYYVLKIQNFKAIKFYVNSY